MHKRSYKSAPWQQKGQSTVEYIVLVSAVIGVLILFLVNNNSPFRTSLNTTLDTVSRGMTNMADRMNQPIAPANATSPTAAIDTNPTTGACPNGQTINPTTGACR